MMTLPGEPRVDLFVGEEGASVGLQVRGASQGDLPRLQMIEATDVEFDGEMVVRLSCRRPELFEAFYGFACAVADSIQLEGTAPSTALAGRLREWRALLAGVPLNERALVGLLGELWLFECLLSRDGAASAIDAWRAGASPEEHDFGLRDDDIEVKSTLSERRDHWVTSFLQLMPSGLRPLHVVSVQFTRAGDSGFHAQDVVRRLHDLCLSHSGEAATQFDELMAGFDSVLREAAAMPRLRLRSQPMLVRVEPPVPAVTPVVLESALGRESLARLVRGEYVVNLDGLGVPAMESDLLSWEDSQEVMANWL